MTLGEWLKTPSDLLLGGSKHLNQYVVPGDYDICCWADDKGWWVVQVLDDGTAVTMCDD